MTGSELPAAPRSAAYLAGLAQLVEQLPVVTWSVDPDLRITSAAGGALAALGFSADGLLGQRVAALIGDVADPVIDAHHRALAGEAVQYGASVGGRAFEAVVRPLRAHDGAIVGAMGLALDVSERHRMQGALDSSEAHYRALVEDAAVGIFRSSADGRLLAANPAMAAMLGYAHADDMIGLNMAADVYVDPGLRARLTDRYANTDRVAGVDVEWRRRDGSAITVRLSGRPVRDASGAIASWEMIAEDVTEFRRVEHQLRQSQKMEALGRLTGGVAHDFNNILTAILANADLIDAALPPTETQVRADLRDIVDAARRGGDLVKKLIGFSRRERLQMLPANLGGAVEALAPELRRLLPGAVGLDLVTADDDAPAVLLDATALEQILVSLVTNARDAMPQGGALQIRTARVTLDDSYRQTHGWGTPGEYVALEVRDTGLGMDELTRSRAFEPFFTTKPPGAGSGLGLAMVYGLMKQMNGFVRLESGTDRGTLVTLFFPLAPRRHSPLPGPAPAARSGGAVLVVEDEEPIRRVAQRVLERFGYRVIAAANGEEALQIYRDRSAEIGLVLTDIVMPRMGGRELYESLRRQGAQVPVVFTSGHTSRGGERDGEAGGLDPSVPFLPKPWSADELVQRVRASLTP